MALSFLGDVISRKVMLPNVILLIIIGIVFGPILGPMFGLDRGSLLSVIPFLTPLTIAFIAFDSGIRLKVHQVFAHGKRALILSVLGFIISTFAIGVFLHFTFGLRWAYSYLLASAWGGVSMTTVIAVCKQLKIGGETLTTLTMSSLIDDILVLITALTILNYIILGGISYFEITLTLIRNIAISFFFGLVIGIIWLNILYRAEKGEYTFTFTIAALLLVYSATELLGGTGGIASFLFALVLGSADDFSNLLRLKIDKYRLSRLNDLIQKFHSELTFMLVTFFFTFIGLTYVFTGYFDLFLGLIISLLLHVTRFLGVKIGTWRSSLSSDLPAIGLIVGKGAAAAAMSTLPLAYNLPNTDMFTSVALNVILFTNILSIILPFAARRSKYY